MPKANWVSARPKSLNDAKRRAARVNQFKASLGPKSVLTVPQDYGTFVTNSTALENGVTCLYTDGCATCIGICVVGENYSYLGHMDADSTGNAADILAEILQKFDDAGDSIKSVSVVSGTAFNHNQTAQGAMGENVLKFLEDSSDFDDLNVMPGGSALIHFGDDEARLTVDGIEASQMIDPQLSYASAAISRGDADIDDYEDEIPAWVTFEKVSMLADETDENSDDDDIGFDEDNDASEDEIGTEDETTDDDTGFEDPDPDETDAPSPLENPGGFENEAPGLNESPAKVE